MGQALYRKYRSQSLDEIVGQEHIVGALKNAVKDGRISHAYLFTGPRGIGKTSIARILAHEINGLAYSTEPHLDIIEIDAASNRRIDEIRELRDKVYVAPTSARYKVYIIDEVHMLTREAFNALLKTLEEPPAHVVFILATTDAHKLPETIISRTQRYNFKPVAAGKVAEHLAFIAKQEGIKADAEALLLLAEHGEGSFRDSISMLDQVSNHGKRVTVDAVRAQLGIPPDSLLDELLAALHGQDITAPVQALETLYGHGYRPQIIAEQLAARLRTQVATQSAGLPPRQALDLLRQLLDVPGSSSPDRYLEITLMDALTPLSLSTVPAAVAATLTPAVQVAAPPDSLPGPEPITPAAPAEPKPAAPAADAPKTSKSSKPEAPAAKKPAQKAAGTAVITPEQWAQVLAALKKQYNTMYGIVRMAHTDFSEPGTVGLSFAFAFHQKRINDPKNRQIVADVIEEVTGQKVALVCRHEPNAVPSKLPAVDQALTVPAAPQTTGARNEDVDIGAVSAIFGDAELL